MAKLSPAQIAGYASGAGFKGSGLTIAVAVALAESGGNATITHANANGTMDRGLWQINSVHSQYNSGQLLTPAYNAKAAYQMSSGGSNWSPWVTYTSGAYKRYMSAASSAGSGTSATSLTVDNVFNQNQLWRWYAQNGGRGTNMFDGVSEKGIDYSTAWGTPVGVITGGKVVRLQHNKTSVGDVVEIQADDGSVMLYQHITAKVKGGQILSTGNIVGLENGLPVDQYSTGPHIEVRYCPPGNWKASIVSWNEPWVNPFHLFSVAGKLPATGANVPTYGDKNNGVVIASAVGFQSLMEQVHETLINTPGFYGIALALDEAEQFPGYIDLTKPQPDITIAGADTGYAPPDITGMARSFGATMTDNFVPFAIRSGLVTIGMVLLIALSIKAVNGPMEVIGAAV